MPMGLRNGPPHFQHCMNKIILTSGMYKIAGIFIDDMGSGGLDHKDSAHNSNAML